MRLDNVILSPTAPVGPNTLWAKPLKDGFTLFCLDRGKWQPLKGSGFSGGTADDGGSGNGGGDADDGSPSFDDRLMTTVYVDQNVLDPFLAITGSVAINHLDDADNVLVWIRENSSVIAGGICTAIGSEKEGYFVYKKVSYDSYNETHPRDSLVTGCMGDFFLKLPTFYYRVVALPGDDAGKFALQFAKEAVDDGYGEWSMWSTNWHIGIYGMSIDSYGRGRSLPGVEYALTDNTSSEETYCYNDYAGLAHARGDYYILTPYAARCVMAYLYMGWYGNLDSQETLGAGINGDITEEDIDTGAFSNLYSLYTGLLDFVPIAIDTYGEYKQEDGGNRFFGVENWWGAVNEYIEDVKGDIDMMGGFTYYREEMSYLPDATERTLVTSKELPDGLSGFVTMVSLGEGGIVPSATGGSVATGYCDYASIDLSNAEGAVAFAGGWNANATAGIFNIELGASPDSPYPYTGARLCHFGYFPDIELEEDEELQTYLSPEVVTEPDPDDGDDDDNGGTTPTPGGPENPGFPIGFREE